MLWLGAVVGRSNCWLDGELDGSAKGLTGAAVSGEDSGAAVIASDGSLEGDTVNGAEGELGVEVGAKVACTNTDDFKTQNRNTVISHDAQDATLMGRRRHTKRVRRS